MMTNPITNYIGCFMNELAVSGVSEAVICPGSRSTPLAIMASAHPEIHTHVLIDERSAAFFALGLAKASGKPVMLICTSGTAGANFYPAIIEANYSRVPLVIVTADRPHELRDAGAPQAIDQQFLYGNFVKWFTDLALPEEREEMLPYVRRIALRAGSEAARHPRGPVHVNVPLREPLMPDLESLPFEKEKTANKQLHIRNRIVETKIEFFETLIPELEKRKEGLIVCGELADDETREFVLKLSRHLKYPILADPLSNLRNSGHDASTIIDAYDSFLKDETIQEFIFPEIVIRFGPMPVSKPLFQLLQKHPEISQIVVDPGGGWRDPTLNSTWMLNSSEEVFIQTVLEHAEPNDDSTWVKKWKFVNDRFRFHLKRMDLEDDWFEGKVYQVLQPLIPDNSSVFLGNSMPIRDADTFFGTENRSYRLFANRGANGIDGVVSTAIGVREATKRPVTLVIGDLSFYHDLNGLLACKTLNIPLTIILINNDGGGIFSFLPQSTEKIYFESLFGTPTGLEFEHAAKLYGGYYVVPDSWEQFIKVYKSSVNSPGLHVIEVKTNRENRVEIHRNLLQKVSREIRKEWPF
ncbi:2-succinyl-5-enolpyruvyl-6-hydroxy-3-cyclohexene-1-carboxylic-acid synthase [Bacillus capparidis]|nr:MULTISPECIES: 2-succinyl-5-enolpyruvyl-6-hydroxy-3-cyclohexene-1-carboxylic-acid synthase [Bacillus]MED1097897.1 2-succinyl-5-enolpyruvyl-6-hydroxy-3-cyclohexene-1-carboxylic-acid synthase [Bacillus capparidis]